MPSEGTNSIRRFYKHLLQLYPSAFRDRFGEQMEQNFDDLWNERDGAPAAEKFWFASSMLAEAGGGILRERASQLTTGEAMKTNGSTVIAAVPAGFVIVLPLMIMEAVNRRNLPEAFPVVLFTTMWLLATIFGVIAVSVGRSIIAEAGLRRHPVRLLLGAVFALSIAVFWSGLLVDQMPCFLGVPKCD